MHRRLFLAALLTVAAAPALAAPPKPTAVEVGKLFPFLGAYLKLPAGERSRFGMVYTVLLNERPYGGPIGTLIDGEVRIPIASAASGRVERLPTLAQLQAKRKVEFPPGPSRGKFGMRLALEPSVRLAPEMSAPELAAAITQAAAGAKKAAGIMRMAVPRLTRVQFTGGTGGEVVLADGRTAPLTRGDQPGLTFTPAQHPTARTIRFRTAPTAIAIE